MRNNSSDKMESLWDCENKSILEGLSLEEGRVGVEIGYSFNEEL